MREYLTHYRCPSWLYQTNLNFRFCPITASSSGLTISNDRQQYSGGCDRATHFDRSEERRGAPGWALRWSARSLFEQVRERDRRGKEGTELIRASRSSRSRRRMRVSAAPQHDRRHRTREAQAESGASTLAGWIAVQSTIAIAASTKKYRNSRITVKAATKRAFFGYRVIPSSSSAYVFRLFYIISYQQNYGSLLMRHDCCNAAATPKEPQEQRHRSPTSSILLLLLLLSLLLLLLWKNVLKIIYWSLFVMYRISWCNTVFYR